MQSNEAGFTLVEVLVAFAIASMSLALLFGIHSRSTDTVVMAEEYLVATELAQSLIDELSVTESALEFTRSGRFADKYTWTEYADEYSRETSLRSGVDGLPPDRPSAAVPFSLQEIVVTVTWASRRRPERFELRTNTVRRRAMRVRLRAP